MYKDFALTPPPPDHSISPESSDGFASVGTILPKEEAALLPGGLFVSGNVYFSPLEPIVGVRCERISFREHHNL